MSRAEILEVARKHQWLLPEDTTKPNVLLVSRRQKLIIRFDAHERLIGAALRRPLPFNADNATTPITAPHKVNVLRILRGEA